MIRRLYSTAQLLSLDIVIGVVILLRFFCAQLEIQVTWHVYFLLASTVWLIYTLDHIQDADKAPKAKRGRYIFHRRHKSILIIVAICLIFLMIPFAFFIPLAILLGGLLLGLLSLVYLLVQSKLPKYFSKELYVAIVYSTGILLVPIIMGQSFQWDILVLLILLSFTNLILFSWFEEKEDASDGFNSLATEVGGKRLEKLTLLLISVGFSLSIIKWDVIHVFFLIAFSMYVMMVLFPVWFKKNERYRSLGDSVFLFPILFEWL